MKQKIVIKSFGALSYELVLHRTEIPALDAPGLAPPRLRMTPEEAERPTVLAGPQAEMRSGNQTGVRQSLDHFRGACVRTLPVLFESRLLDQPLASGQTQDTPAPPADTTPS
jgi:hypothetical protein